MSVGGIDIGSDQIVKFDSVKTNIGGGYDPITGVFIAPNPGIYQFVSVIYSNGNDDVEAQMNKNNELLLRMDGIVITHVTYPSSYIELSIILLKSTLLYSEFYQII
jgi:hypothetical protein